MDSYQDFLEGLGWRPCRKNAKYCEVGKTFYTQSEDLDGLYWYYENDLFIMNIHDFFIKREMMVQSFPDMSPFMSFSTSYIKAASGECFAPYQTLTANTMFVSPIRETHFRFLLHANFPYLSVGINFKEKMIQDYVFLRLEKNHISVSDIFFDTRKLVTKPMEKLANSILACNMNFPAGEIFFEAKAKEWLSITLDAYFNKVNSKQISPSDERAIENVAKYIDDHYALDVPQGLLEKISMMSGTKLKNSFKQKYQMSITEYTQRKRMTVAETLLSTTELEINHIAKAVGYNSHSRFTALFKKYKGIYPREVRKLNSHHSSEVAFGSF